MIPKTNAQYLTVRDLYEFASAAHLLDAPLRICDGMAVSYFPELKSLHIEHYETVIDVSDLEPIEYDELNFWKEAIAPELFGLNPNDNSKNGL